ncbi:16S rRNA (uracil(1498)-N(3))-methyltransferase [Motiliproteus sp. SC1-56]|uniref:16S rRNA (uracil(1498)-N(3))-methyltransferase n=1 Tax=Motiliproteus sp. SC1-56 TaxID=2799565 RepID=UPI001A8F769B|nr:16S rRNA (uracil(1498)-N(3))-methyltransferase [Motiliproteus sp. SC1-56]
MRVPRVYDPQPLHEGAELALGAFAAQHLGRVLRMGPGDEVVVFNGEGGEFPARIVEVTKKTVRVQLAECRPVPADPRLSISLGQGISRGERMDYALQKATELGVGTVTPLFTERCEVRLNAERQAKRTAHWQQVAVSAAEQCLRSRVPDVSAPRVLADWVQQVDAELKLILHPEAPRALGEFARPASVALLVGPEGGLSDTELEQARAAGFVPLSLGPRVLRTETAPVAALSVLQYLWGDLA